MTLRNQNSDVQSTEISPSAQPNYPAQPTTASAAQLSQPAPYRASLTTAQGWPGEAWSAYPVSDVFLARLYEMAPPDLQRHVVVGAQTLSPVTVITKRNRWRIRPGNGSRSASFQAQRGLATTGALTGNFGCSRPSSRATGPHFRREFGQTRADPIYRGEWVPDR